MTQYFHIRMCYKSIINDFLIQKLQRKLLAELNNLHNKTTNIIEAFFFNSTPSRVPVALRGWPQGVKILKSFASIFPILLVILKVILSH